MFRHIVVHCKVTAFVSPLWLALRFYLFRNRSVFLKECLRINKTCDNVMVKLVWFTPRREGVNSFKKSFHQSFKIISIIYRIKIVKYSVIQYNETIQWTVFTNQPSSHFLGIPRFLIFALHVTAKLPPDRLHPLSCPRPQFEKYVATLKEAEHL